MRGSKAVSHQRHAGLIATAVAVPAPPSIMYSPNLLACLSAHPGITVASGCILPELGYLVTDAG